MIRTAWIGGSYEAATRQTITDLPPTAISRRHAEPGMGADVPLLKLIQAMPGSRTEGYEWGVRVVASALWMPGSKEHENAQAFNEWMEWIR